MIQTSNNATSAARSVVGAFGVVISLILIVGSISLLPHDNVVSQVCRWAPCPQWLTPRYVLQLLKLLLGLGVIGMVVFSVLIFRSRRT